MFEVRIAWRDDTAASTAGIAPAIADLLSAGVAVDTMRALGAVAAVDIDRLLGHLQSRGLLAWEMCGLRAVPLGAWVPAPHVEPASGRLSRFAHVRLAEGAWVLESALSPWRVHLPEGALSLEAFQEADQGAWLAALGMLDRGDERARDWTFHDRLFRARWRWDTPGRPEVETDVRPPPALRPVEDAANAERVSLPVPSGPGPDEPTLWAATESRRTHREFHADAVPVATLGALLWRVLRVTSQEEGADIDGRTFEALRRPVPASGSLHCIDLWLLTRAVEGIEPAWWWYDPVGHALVRVAPATGAGEVSSADDAPVYGVLTARHARTAWKYPSWAHALELRDAGVIFHALQVTGVATGLGVWLLGTGSDRTIARALGVDPEQDAPVGEFALGLMP